MKALFLAVCAIYLSGCTSASQTGFVGTWKMRDSAYFMRVYSDGRTAIWTPEGKTGWTTLENNILVFHAQPPLRDPALTRKGPNMVMHTDTADQVFDRVPRNLEPPK